MTSTRAGGIGRIIARMVVTMMQTTTRSRRVFAQRVRPYKTPVMFPRQPCPGSAYLSDRVALSCHSQPHGKGTGAPTQDDPALLDPLDHPSVAGERAFEQLLAAPIDDIGP